MVLLFLNMYRTDDSVAVFGQALALALVGTLQLLRVLAVGPCWFDEEAFEGDEESESCYQWLAWGRD